MSSGKIPPSPPPNDPSILLLPFSSFPNETPPVMFTKGVCPLMLTSVDLPPKSSIYPPETPTVTFPPTEGLLLFTPTDVFLYLPHSIPPDFDVPIAQPNPPPTLPKAEASKLSPI